MDKNLSTLQINTSGAWRNVASFNPVRTPAVMAAAGQLSEALGGEQARRAASFCIVNAEGVREWVK